jgi:hypothetical protein
VIRLVAANVPVANVPLANVPFANVPVTDKSVVLVVKKNNRARKTNNYLRTSGKNTNGEILIARTTKKTIYSRANQSQAENLCRAGQKIICARPNTSQMKKKLVARDQTSHTQITRHNARAKNKFERPIKSSNASAAIITIRNNKKQ